MVTVLAIIALVGLLVPVFEPVLRRRVDVSTTWASSPYWGLLPVGALLSGLVVMGIERGGFPMSTVGGGLQTMALLVSLGWLVLRRRERMEAAGMILSSLASVLVMASLVGAPENNADVQSSTFFVLHFGLIFLGLGGFAVSFAISALYLIQRRRLKTKQLQGIQDLPSMEVLDGLNFKTQGLGFVALTVGIAMGVVLAVERSSNLGAGDITVWGTAAVWVWYAVGLHARLIGGWRGHTAAIFGAVGFGALSLILGAAVVLVGSWHGA